MEKALSPDRNITVRTKKIRGTKLSEIGACLVKYAVALSGIDCQAVNVVARSDSLLVLASPAENSRRNAVISDEPRKAPNECSTYLRIF